MNTVRCRVCHREERWEGETHEIVVEGGARRSPLHPELAAWRTLVDSHAGKAGPVVAACAACGQPMVADAEGLSSIAWEVHTPDGPVVVKRHGLRGPSGPIEWSEANALVEGHYAERFAIGDYLGPGALLQTSMMMTMLVPVALWLAAVAAVVIFMMNYEGR